MKKTQKQSVKKNLYKMSIPVQLFSEATSLAHFYFVVVASFVMVLFLVRVFLPSERPDSAPMFLQDVTREQIAILQKYRELDPKRYSVDLDETANSIKLSVIDRNTGYKFLRTFTKETLDKNASYMFLQPELAAIGSVEELLTNSVGETKYSAQRFVYDLQSADPYIEGKTPLIMLLWSKTTFMIVMILVSTVITHFMYVYFKSVRQGIFFSAENVKNLKLSGIFAFFGFLMPILFNFVLSIISMKGEYNFTWFAEMTRFDWSWTYAVLSLSFLLLAEIVQRGHELQIEKDLTI